MTRTLLWLGPVLWAAVAVAQQKPEIDPYAATAIDPGRHGVQPVALNPGALNVLSPSFARLSAGLRMEARNHMALWVVAEKPGSHSIEWLVDAPEAGVVEVESLLVSNGCEIALAVNDRAHPTVSVAEKKWNRVSLGSVTLAKGRNRLLLGFKGRPCKLSTIELVRPTVKKTLLKDALAKRNAPEWFKDAGHGLMFQWTNRATPPKGKVKPWGQKVDDFDLDAFVQLVDESGASFVVWSITWGQQYVSAPIQSLDLVLFGRTTKRDLLGEMAERLHAKGVRLIFYYHYGYDCYHSKDPDWMKAAGGYDADKTRFYQNWVRIVSEIGTRYGEKLDGWFFDGGQRYYNTHFDGSAPEGMLSAPFKELRVAALSGNPQRVICYNSWILPRLTEYQDFFAGEGQASHGQLDDGVFAGGPQRGLLAFGCFVLERRWGHIEEDKLIAPPRYSPEKLLGRIRHAKANRHPVAINLEMYEDGSVSPASRALLKNVREQLNASTEGD